MGVRALLIRLLGGQVYHSNLHPSLPGIPASTSAALSSSASLSSSQASLNAPEHQFRYAEELNNQGRPELATAFYRQAYVQLRVLTSSGPSGPLSAPQRVLPESTHGLPIADVALSAQSQPSSSPLDRITVLRQSLTSANASQVEQELRQLIMAGARSADSFCLLGMCHILQNKPPDAERAFREALRLNSGHYRSLVNLGGLLLKLGRPEEAIPLLESSLQHTNEASPESLAALTNLAVAQSQLGRTIDAAQLVLRIFRIKPDHLQPDKLAAAANTLVEMGDDPAAIELLQYLRQLIRHPDLNRRLAELLERRGDYQQAALVYRDLAGNSP